METIERNYAVLLMLDSNMRVFLQKKDSGYFWGPNMWCTPGGGLKNNESPEDALRREIKKEIGITLGQTMFILKQEFEEFSKIGTPKKRFGKVYNYAARFDGELERISIGEGAGFAFFEEEEVEKYNKSKMIIPVSYGGVKELYRIIKRGELKVK